MAKVSKRARIVYVTAAALSSTFIGSPAWASCVSQAPVDPKNIICGAVGATGWAGSATDGLKVTVETGATVSVPPSPGAPLISTGALSSVINNGGTYNNGAPGGTVGIDAGNHATSALSVGGGTQITNNADATIVGSVTFGTATGANTNILNNLYSHSGSTNLIGDMDSDHPVRR